MFLLAACFNGGCQRPILDEDSSENACAREEAPKDGSGSSKSRSEPLPLDPLKAAADALPALDKLSPAFLRPSAISSVSTGDAAIMLAAPGGTPRAAIDSGSLHLVTVTPAALLTDITLERFLGRGAFACVFAGASSGVPCMILLLASPPALHSPCLRGEEGAGWAQTGLRSFAAA